VEKFVWKTKSNEWLFRKKNFSYAFYLDIHNIYNFSYDWDALQKRSVYKNGSRQHASWLTKTFRTQKSTKGWMTNKTLHNHKSTRFGWFTTNIPQTRKKNKGYMQLHKIRQCCKQFTWSNSRQYCNSVENFVLIQKNTQTNYKCWEKFLEIWC
jgi:hypothetical protein